MKGYRYWGLGSSREPVFFLLYRVTMVTHVTYYFLLYRVTMVTHVTDYFLLYRALLVSPKRPGINIITINNKKVSLHII